MIHALREKQSVCDRVAVGTQVAIVQAEARHREFFLAGDRAIAVFAECIDDIEAKPERLRELDLEWNGTGRPHVLVLRAHRLRRPFEIAPRPEGWFDLEQDPAVETEGPVLNRTELRTRLERIQSVLEG